MMTERYLYGTTVPVLLDGGKKAGKTARLLYTRYGLESHCFGAKRHILTSIYTKWHAALPFTQENDAVTRLLLHAFAEEWGTGVGILSLIPCSPEAQAFLERNKTELESVYVLLAMPAPHDNPLRALVRRD